MALGNRLSGRQITTSVVAVCIAVIAFPMTVFAATGNLVNITDPVMPSHKARVDSAGRLSVGDGGGSLTIDGSTRLAAPSSPFTISVTLNVTGPTAVLLVQRRGHQRLAITSITAWDAPNNGTSQVVRFISFVEKSATFVCPSSPAAIGTGHDRDVPLLTVNSPIDVAYPSPLVFFNTSSAATTSCLYASSTQVGVSNFLITTTLNGFWTN